MYKTFFNLLLICLLPVLGFGQFSGSSSYVLTAATGGTNYQWFNNGAAISGATSNTYTASTPGNYYATFNNGTCATKTPNAVIVNSGTSTTFNASSTSGTSYQWSSSGAPIGGATSSSYTTSTGGIYSVDVVTSACTATSNNYYLYVLSSGGGGCLAGNTAPTVN